MVNSPRGSTTLAARPHRPWLAALLSFVFPGLGQAYAGRPRLAAVLAVPVLILVLTGIVLIAGLAGNLGNDLLSSSFLIGVLALNVALFLWRAFAISHAGLTPAALVRGRERRVAIVAVSALLLATMAMHGWVGVVVAHLDGTLTQVFSSADGSLEGSGTDDDESSEDGTDQPGDGKTDPDSEPLYQWDGEERINVLLLGTDAVAGRERILTDVIMVVSVDPVAETAVMISVPRDTGFMPLPDRSVYPDGVFPFKINELAAHAVRSPERWCADALVDDPTACGIRTLERAVGLYLGIEIHHYALVDMAGFAELIDALGGVELCLPGRLVDPEFDGSLENSRTGEPLILPAGCHHYGGVEALAYARSRQGWIEMPDRTREQQTDFDRNERQQRLLLALRRELADADLIFELPAVLGAVGRTVSTDVPREQAGDLATLMPLVTGPDIERVVLGHPEFVDLPAQPGVNYLLVPRRDAVRDEMARIFGADELVGWYLGSLEAGPPPSAAP